MITVLTILVGLAMLATLGVLLAGILGMAGGSGDSRRSNLLMRWRIGLQFIALALFAILLLLLKQ
ncbi:twin transmembrane helix small protein [Neoroseomonas soli]|uniref:Twin transmembrane helix small protein n=1 Tax=Neoroseomonas soli TaxID=1081025 RepID=A0A9X9X3C3_9PROT|nr:twin transmembrane helix small protein [Neoroseomonas soli]MBR0673902.1 twin transmembrane helix small protein [Neoroseomonas soli]